LFAVHPWEIYIGPNANTQAFRVRVNVRNLPAKQQQEIIKKCDAATEPGHGCKQVDIQGTILVEGKHFGLIGENYLGDDDDTDYEVNPPKPVGQLSCFRRDKLDPKDLAHIFEMEMENERR
jgi:hypothetical protein